jgi:hypothetical protein
MSRTDVARAILASPESNTREVQGIYLELLRRDADPAGLAGFVAAANSGVSDEVIRAQIAGSPEYFARSGSSS